VTNIDAFLNPPARLGPYTVGPRIGGGGMAAIHLGVSVLDASSDVVAIKIMRAEISRNPQYIAMFRDEAAILSRMRHPNIVRTLEYGIAGEHSYIAMELLLGRTLAEVWDAARAHDFPLPARLVAWIGARAAAALHYAHELRDEKGKPLHVVHRDANPANVVLTYEGEVKLIDFGLAKAARRFARTEDGVVKGKVPYLAPEQILEEEADHRSDIFTLGASLWEMITGQRLFKRDTDVDTIRAIRDGHIPKLSEAAPWCGPELVSIVMRCLEMDRSKRWQNAGELEVALDTLFGRDDAREAAVVANMLERLFPGERAAREAWRSSGSVPH